MRKSGKQNRPLRLALEQQQHGHASASFIILCKKEGTEGGKNTYGFKETMWIWYVVFVTPLRGSVEQFYSLGEPEETYVEMY